MRSATSSSERVHQWFYPALLKKNTARFWPLWLCWGLFWFLLLVPRIVEESRYWLPKPTALYPRRLLLPIITNAGPMLAAFFGIAAAMLLFSYLYHHRSAGFFHALPVRREGLFLTNYISGLLFLVVPLVVVAIFTGLAELWVGNGFDFPSLFLLVFCVGMMGFFFYSFAVFCAMFTGHILALPAFYGILNALVAVVVYLLDSLANLYLFGYVTNPDLYDVAQWFTPLAKLMSDLSYDDEYHIVGLFPIFVYAFFGVVFAVLALIAYRRRRIESAGDVVAVPWVRPIFKYGVSLCAALTLGTGLWTLFFSFNGGKMQLALCVLLCGAVGYFIAEMLLSKSFRVFKKSWKGCVLALVLIGMGCAVPGLDLTGYQSRVPSVQSVVSVSVTSPSYPYDALGYNKYTFTDPEQIAQVTGLHQSIVDRRSSLEHTATTFEFDVDDSGYTYADTCSVRLTYTLTGGRTMTRYYSAVPVTDELLADSDTPAARLTALFNAPGVAAQEYFEDWSEKDSLSYLTLNQNDRIIKTVDGGDAQKVLKAVQADMAAGDLGRRFLMQDRSYYQSSIGVDLCFTFYTTRDIWGDSTAPDDHSYTVTIRLQNSAAQTLSVLEELGLSDVLPPAAAN